MMMQRHANNHIPLVSELRRCESIDANILFWLSISSFQTEKVARNDEHFLSTPNTKIIKCGAEPKGK
jgi:hypothetical protein